MHASSPQPNLKARHLIKDVMQRGNEKRLIVALPTRSKPRAIASFIDFPRLVSGYLLGASIGTHGEVPIGLAALGELLRPKPSPARAFLHPFLVNSQANNALAFQCAPPTHTPGLCDA